MGGRALAARGGEARRGRDASERDPLVLQISQSGVGVQLPQAFPVSLFRPRYADGETPPPGANLGMVQALWPRGRATCKATSKTARFLYQILHTG